jgi:hypothetical protein
MMKVDVFISRNGIYDREVFRRVVRKKLEEGSREFDLATAEDVILRKHRHRVPGGSGRGYLSSLSSNRSSASRSA